MTNWPTIHASGDPEVERRARDSPLPRSRLSCGPALLLAVFCTAAVWLTGNAHAITPPWEMFAVLAVLYALSGLVEFEVGAVYTDCSLTVLAAMMVALPPACCPGASPPARPSAP